MSDSAASIYFPRLISVLPLCSSSHILPTLAIKHVYAISCPPECHFLRSPTCAFHISLSVCFWTVTSVERKNLYSITCPYSGNSLEHLPNMVPSTHAVLLGVSVRSTTMKCVSSALSAIHLSFAPPIATTLFHTITRLTVEQDKLTAYQPHLSALPVCFPALTHLEMSLAGELLFGVFTLSHLHWEIHNISARIISTRLPCGQGNNNIGGAKAQRWIVRDIHTCMNCWDKLKSVETIRITLFDNFDTNRIVAPLNIYINWYTQRRFNKRNKPVASNYKQVRSSLDKYIVSITMVRILGCGDLTIFFANDWCAGRQDLIYRKPSSAFEAIRVRPIDTPKKGPCSKGANTIDLFPQL